MKSRTAEGTDGTMGSKSQVPLVLLRCSGMWGIAAASLPFYEVRRHRMPSYKVRCSAITCRNTAVHGSAASGCAEDPVPQKNSSI
jgi:hypothetical protein